MTKRTTIELLPLGIPLLLLAFLVLLVKSPMFLAAPKELSLAITLDLMVTLPFVYYLVIRKKAIPKFSVISVFIIGIIIASFLLPAEHQGLLSQIKYIAIPLFEVGLLVLIVVKTRKIRLAFQAEGKEQLDFYDTLLAACSAALPARIGKVIATEIAVIYYSFSWAKQREIQANEFTYFKKNGIKTTVSVFLFLVLVETTFTHILVARWKETVAWVLTFIGLYTCLQVFALLRSMGRRLVCIDVKQKLLHLRYGFFYQTAIPFEQIKKIELSRKSLPEDNSILPFSPFNILDPHNIVIHLKEEQTLHKIYGFEKRYSALAFYLDEKERFVAEMGEVI